MRRLCCDILVVFVDQARQDIFTGIVIQPPSIGDILPNRDIIVIVDTGLHRILFLPKLDDERLLHLVELGCSTGQSRQVANARKLWGKLPYLISLTLVLPPLLAPL